MTFEDMSLEDLFVALRAASIAEYEADDGAPQHAAALAEGAIVREIAKREGREPHYRRMLDDSHPSVRYRGAIGIKKLDPRAAMPVFRSLAGSRLQAGLAVIALDEVIALEKLGIE